MKYLILIISILLLSGSNYPQSIKNGTELHMEYFSIDTYQNDYKSLQEKSQTLNIKVKNILDIFKSH